MEKMVWHPGAFNGRRVIIAIAIFATFLRGADAQASDSNDLIKAAFIYNFARFTDWPADSFERAGDSVRICFREDNPLSAALASIAGKKIGERSIELIRMNETVSFPPTCHIALLTDSEASRSVGAVRGLLTVGDIQNFNESGVAIGLMQVGRQVRFQINATAIKRADLRMSSKLLRLAAKVIQ